MELESTLFNVEPQCLLVRSSRGEPTNHMEDEDEDEILNMDMNGLTMVWNRTLKVKIICLTPPLNLNFHNIL